MSLVHLIQYTVSVCMYMYAMCIRFFNNFLSQTYQDFPEEAVMFSEMTVSWKGLMEHAESVKSCIQV